MASGNAAKAQLGIETVYGTIAPGEVQVRISSEGFKYSPNKKEEGLLTGGKATGRSYTMGVKAEGSLSTNLRPDEAGYWLGLGLGDEGTPALEDGSTGAYKHTFTAIGTAESDHLPSSTFIIDRVVDVFSYPGCKITDFSFSASPGDYLKLDANFAGKSEEDGTLNGALSPSTLKPLRFQHAVVKLAGNTIADITSIKFNYNNNPEQDLQTSSTGLYYKEPEAGARSCTMDLEVLYTVTTEALKSYLKSDADLSVEIAFTSEEEIETGFPYSLTITVPHAQINSSDANVSGANILRQTLNLIAIEDSPDEFITVELINDRATAYI